MPLNQICQKARKKVSHSPTPIWKLSSSFSNGSILKPSTSNNFADDDEVEDMTDAEIYTENRSLVELWVFGDKYLIPVLQNIATDTIVSVFKARNEASTQLFNYIYDNTTEVSMLRKYIVELCVVFGGAAIFDQVEDFRVPLFADICRRFAAIREEHGLPGDFKAMDIDDFHVDE
ncbi:hypothetical protein BKA65DRAFT_570469 [Rhexocercosporidium sp. MPI-PUGE-AT-0058]|nr:hypothetical protein BKA65DRAFT_570469 [Rhexocercosporidium sp. MPI-PUGE-AT-0058]